MALDVALIRLDRASGVPLHEQIARRLVARIDHGAWAPGDSLPSTRALATRLGVHRLTVVRAYASLRAQGYVDAHPGARFVVRTRATRSAATRASSSAVPRRLRGLASSTRAALEPRDRAPHDAPPEPGVLDLATHIPDPRLLPTALLSRIARAGVSGDHVQALAHYGDPRGLPDLRVLIARRMARYGIDVAQEQVIVTDGAQHAIDLVLRTLLRPGSELLVESPGYSRVFTLARAIGVDVVPVPMTPDGLDLAALRSMLRRTRAAMLYTMPECQNPTGISTSAAHREALLALANHAGIGVLEDGFDEELQYVAPAALPLRAMDGADGVIHVGTLSKLLAPGLRLGWLVAAPPLANRIARLRSATGLAGNAVTQRIGAQLLAHPEFDRYIRRLRRELRARHAALASALAQHLPPWVQWSAPAGGYTFWLSWSSTRISEATVVRRAAAIGVAVTAGRGAFASPSRDAHLRLSIAVATSEQLAIAAERLGDLMRARRSASGGA